MANSNDVLNYDGLNDVIQRIVKHTKKINSSITVLENNARSMYTFFTYPKTKEDKLKKDVFNKLLNVLMTLGPKVRNIDDKLNDVSKNFELSNFLAKSNEYIENIEDSLNKIEIDFDSIKLITPPERFRRPLDMLSAQIIEYNRLINLLIEKYDLIKSNYRSLS